MSDTRTFPDSRRHLRLCFPLSISFLCTFLSSLGSALIYHRFPRQSRLERRSVLKRICAIPGPSRTVGFTSVYAFVLVSVSPAKTSTNAKPDKARKQEQHQGKQGSERKGQREKANNKAAKTSGPAILMCSWSTGNCIIRAQCVSGVRGTTYSGPIVLLV